MWQCKCNLCDEDWHRTEEQFCRYCGDAKPWKPDVAQIARFQGIRALAEAGRYSEQIEHPGEGPSH